MEFTVRIDCGDVFINDKFVSQLCFDADAIGCAIAMWLQENNQEEE